MEYRKSAVGTKLRFVGNEERYDYARNGDVLIVIEDDGTDMPYRCVNERNYEREWFYAKDVEVVEESVTPSPFRKVVTLLFDEGIEVTLDVGGTVSVKDGDGGDVRSIPLATLIAAVDELRGHAK